MRYRKHGAYLGVPCTIEQKENLERAGRVLEMSMPELVRRCIDIGLPQAVEEELARSGNLGARLDTVLLQEPAEKGKGRPS